MELSPGQIAARDKCAAWYNNPSRKPFFYIAGYAGTGKSTIAKAVQEACGVESALYGTFTGKAASVLKRKGNPAETIHSLVYRPIPVNAEKLKGLYRKKNEAKSDAEKAEIQKIIREELKPKFVLQDLDESKLANCDLLVIDEVSMVNEEMGKDLLSFKVPILVLGDPGQLPPISGEGFFTRGDPDVMLTEIHRQAADNPIIAMATLARQGHRLKVGKWGDSSVVWKNTFHAEQFLSFDQIICGANRTRKTTNAKVRDLRNYTNAAPYEGEKIICLKNNKELGVLNGTQWIVKEAEDQGVWYSLEIVADGEPESEPIILDCHPFEVDFDNMQWWERKRYEEFDYGYAITCHKSQGSQWGNVLVQDESWMFNKPPNSNGAKWLYTALTRAEKNVTVLL